MKSRHIAMFSLLNPGHVYPMLDVCAQLNRRGHRITYPVTDRFAEKVRRTGAEPQVFKIPRLTDAEKILRFPSPDDPRRWQLVASLIYPPLITAAAAMVAELETFYRENPPDLIVYDRYSFGARILAHLVGCPTVQVWSHFAHRDSLVREEGVCRNPEPIRGFAHILDSFMAAYGIEERNNLWRSEDVNIFFHPKEFQFDADSFDHRFHFVGPCLNRQPQGEWTNTGDRRPLLLISESSSMRDNTLLRLCIESFADCDYQVVYSVGANTPPIENSSLPANFQINKDIYNIEILPHAAAIVCQSGMGLAMESLYFAVPMVALPNQSFNAEVAYRLAELGLGIYLRDRDVTPDTLRASVEGLIADTGVRDRLNVMQKAVRSCGGAELAANLIEQALDG